MTLGEGTCLYLVQGTLTCWQVLWGTTLQAAREPMQQQRQQQLMNFTTWLLATSPRLSLCRLSVT